MLRFVLVMFIIAGCGLFVFAGETPDKKASASTGNTQKDKSKVSSGTVADASAVVPQAAKGVNPLTQAAVQNGVLACTSRINQVAGFLINNNQSGAFLFTTKQQPDQHVFSASVEIRPAKGLPIYASATFAPNMLGGCDAAYDTVEYTEQSCTDLGAKAFKGGAPGKLKQDILVYNTGAVKFFLMPAGKGCVVIKKEVVR